VLQNSCAIADCSYNGTGSSVVPSLVLWTKLFCCWSANVVPVSVSAPDFMDSFCRLTRSTANMSVVTEISPAIVNTAYKSRWAPATVLTRLTWIDSVQEWNCGRIEPVADHQLLLVVHGAGEYVLFGHGVGRLADQDLLVVPPGVAFEYRVAAESGLELGIVCCRGKGAESLCQQVGLSANHPVLHACAQHVVKQWITDAIATLREPLSPSSVVRTSHYISTLWAALAQSHADGASDTVSGRAIAKVVTAMETNIAEDLTVEQLASLVGLSASYLSAAFVRATGLPPIRYFSTMKVRRACQSLALGDESIESIAGGLGYSDYRYFDRIFLKVVGCTPRQYRMRVRGRRR
jgi:AraC family transcriptional regulator, arabinose operon regulatory protein